MTALERFGEKGMDSLRAGDCLCPRWMAVEADQRYVDVAGDEREPRVFAVFDSDGEFLGLVEMSHAMLFPGRIFADLLVRRQPSVLTPDIALPDVLLRLQEAKCDYLPVMEPSKRLLGIVSLLSVFEALMVTERRLRDERERLIQSLFSELENRRVSAAVFEVTSEGIVVTDATNRIILVNPAFSRNTGYTEAEVLGKTPAILQSGQHESDFYRAMWQSLSQSGRWQGEIWNRRKDGEVYPEWLHINVVADDSGAVRYHVGVFSDITLHDDLRGKLHHLAYHDPLTDLPNRQLFMDRLTQAVVQAKRSGVGFSLLFIDLDGFKDVNDTLGHRTGDRLLEAVAKRLQLAVRQSDTVARLGGDEFTVILPGCIDEARVMAAAEQIFNRLNRPFEIDGHELFVGASIGAGRFPDDGETEEALLMAADSAMYRAKDEGKGRLSFYSAVLRERAAHRIEILGALRHALLEDGLRVFWQPQVSLVDGAVEGIEALLRWPRLNAEPVPPAEFIPIAEQGGLIDMLGEWVLNTACREAVALCEDGVSGIPRVAVNFSPLQLRPGVEQMVIEAVSNSGLPPESLEIELTESVLSTGQDGVLDFLLRLGDEGIEIAVDDFGTGYSNLAMLKNLPVQKLKIDRALICDLATNPDDREIVAAIIGMAHALKLKVVAEGVETQEQADVLRQMGCDLAQGYLYSPPVPMDDLRTLLEEINSRLTDSSHA